MVHNRYIFKVKIFKVILQETNLQHANLKGISTTWILKKQIFTLRSLTKTLIGDALTK